MPTQEQQIIWDSGYIFADGNSNDNQRVICPISEKIQRKFVDNFDDEIYPKPSNE